MLVSPADLAAYSDLSVEDISAEKLTLANREVAVLIKSYATYLPDDVEVWPEGAKVVALRVLARGHEQTGFAGLSSQSVSAGPFSQSIGISETASSGSYYLTKQDKAILDRRGRKGGAYAVNILPSDTRINGIPGYAEDEWLWRGTTY